MISGYQIGWYSDSNKPHRGLRPVRLINKNIIFILYQQLITLLKPDFKVSSTDNFGNETKVGNVYDC